MKLLDVPDFNKNGNVFYEIARTYSLMNRLDDSLKYLALAYQSTKVGGIREMHKQIGDLKT